MNTIQTQNKSVKAFTLVELLVAVIALAVVLVGLVQVFIRCSVLAELSQNKTVAMSEAQGKLEELRNYNFDNIAADYAYGGALNPFTLDQLNGTGVIYIDSSTADILEIEIVISWENKYGRIIGEDDDLDGVLDTGSPSEDDNGDGKLSSIVTLISRIAARY